MKTFNFTFIFLFLPFFALAQTNTFPASGNVGIGTLNPNVWFGGKVLEISDNRPILSLESTGSLGTIAFINGQTSSSNHTGEFHLNHGYNTTNPELSQLRFATYPFGDLFTLQANGKVGIGTTSPDHKLTVKGKIHAEEVLVDLNVPGPDYVFEEYYDLPTLAEIEAFIKENKHLPEIPSAAEMEADGINLGSMNMLFLKKIEEITLHMINLQKQVQAVESQNDLLKEQNQILRELIDSE